jgi:16S rRNA processing protein RimM
LFNLPAFTLRLPDKGGGGERRFEVEEITGSGASAFIKFKGVDSPEVARLLTGAELIVGREEAAVLGENEFYVEDLRGIRVVAACEGAVSGEADAEDGEVLGTVIDVVEGGGGELLEMRLPSGELRLVPFRSEFFGEVELAKGRVVLLKRWILE